MLISETKLKQIISESIKKIINEALIIEPYLKEIETCAINLKNALDNFKIEMDKWEEEETEDGSIAYFRYVGQLCGANIVLIRNPWNYQVNAAYSESSNEFWIFCRGKESVEWFKEKLSHELTHKLDSELGYASSNQYNAYEMNEDENLPRCFNYLLYRLWNPSEFNAHQVQAINGSFGTLKYEIKKLWEMWENCSEFDENNEIWNYIGKAYLNKPNDTSYSIRKFFLNRTSQLIEKYKEKMYRKISNLNQK